MYDVQSVPWIAFPSGFAETGPNSEFDSKVAFNLDTTTDELQTDFDGIASNVLQCVFFAINWPQVADSPAKLAELVRIGYEYNFWPMSSDRITR